MWITSEANTCNSQPALLGEENLPLLWKCFSGVSPLWETGTAKTHPFRPVLLLCFKTVTSAKSFLGDESSISTETYDQIFKQACGWQYCKAVKDASLESVKWGPPFCPTDKSFNFTKPHFLHLYNKGDKNTCPQGLLRIEWDNAYEMYKTVPNTQYVLKVFLFYCTNFFSILLLNREISILEIRFYIPIDGEEQWFASRVLRLVTIASY